MKNKHRFLDWTTETLICSPSNTTTYIRLDNAKGSVTANPLNVEYMLKTNFHNFPKGDQLTSLGRDFLGEGIFNADNDTWKIQRKIASHKFSPKSLQNFVMNHVKFEISTSGLHSITYASWLLVSTLYPCCLGGDSTHAGAEFTRAFDEAAVLTSGRILYIFLLMWKVKRFFNVGSERALQKSISIVHNYANEIIQSRIEDTRYALFACSNFGSTEIVPTCACELQNVPKGRYLNRWYICWQGMASYVPHLCNGKDGKHLGHELRYEFQPERWLQNGRFKKENPFRFPVFHAGPRMCLGKDMAYLQMKSIAASVIERFEIHVQDKCPKQLLSLTLKMEGGLHEKMKERSVDM
ncbi:hypothetical protein SCA6_010773 [Theobroma cacao]